MTRVLFIGDIHFKHSNVTETSVLINKLKDIADYDFAVLAGDVLDAHERVDVQLLNRAYELVRSLKTKSHVYICVGNHDMINNQQFLTSNHWMNGMKEWSNVTIVDVPVIEHGFVFVPYVYPGRFIEALDTVHEWKQATCIFAHQEIRGCKMGAFSSDKGDEWDVTWPPVISGHIHERQRPQSNVFYPGSALSHSFGCSDDDQGLSIFTFDRNEYVERRISLGIKSKRTMYVKAGDSIKIKDANSSTRIVVSGTVDQISAHKNGKQSCMLKNMGAKIVYKLDTDDTAEFNQYKGTNFVTILSDLVKKVGDADLVDDYRIVMM